MSKGRYEQAEKILRRIAITNKMEFDSVSYQRLVTEEKKVTTSTRLEETESGGGFRSSESGHRFDSRTRSCRSFSIASDVYHRHQHVNPMVRQSVAELSVCSARSVSGLYRISFSMACRKTRVTTSRSTLRCHAPIASCRSLAAESIRIVRSECSRRNLCLRRDTSRARSLGP